jgi:hypothetical protein
MVPNVIGCRGTTPFFGAGGAPFLDGLCAVGAEQHVESFCAQHDADHLGQSRVVVDHEDSRGHLVPSLSFLSDADGEVPVPPQLGSAYLTFPDATRRPSRAVAGRPV